MRGGWQRCGKEQAAGMRLETDCVYGAVTRLVGGRAGGYLEGVCTFERCTHVANLGF